MGFFEPSVEIDNCGFLDKMTFSGNLPKMTFSRNCPKSGQNDIFWNHQNDTGQNDVSWNETSFPLGNQTKFLQNQGAHAPPLLDCHYLCLM